MGRMQVKKGLSLNFAMGALRALSRIPMSYENELGFACGERCDRFKSSLLRGTWRRPRRRNCPADIAERALCDMGIHGGTGRVEAD